MEIEPVKNASSFSEKDSVVIEEEDIAVSNAKDAVERGQWVGKLDFILSCIGYAVGLGNIWRFPYLAYKNGGGAFLFPYIIMLALAGLPLFFMELAVGQFSSQGPISLYGRLNRYFKGIGWAMVVISTLVCIYYNVIIMYSIFYLFASFAPEVPWKTCDYDNWATENCVLMQRIDDLETPTLRIDEINRRYNGSCLTEISERFNDTLLANFTETLKDMPDNLENYTVADLNISALTVFPDDPVLNQSYDRIVRKLFKEDEWKVCRKKIQSPSSEYWSRYVLEIQYSGGIDDLGGVRWQLVLTLIFSWVVIFLCLMKGVRSSGRVVYFTATFPYIVLVILLVRGLMLPGHMDGIMFYITPSWEKLQDANVWADAATQIFYSLGPAFGGLLTFSSYNEFHNNCYRDAIIVAIINCGTSIFAGFVIFSVIGFMAYSTDQAVEDVTTSGVGLLFVAYPEVISQMPISPLWAILFFFMVFTLGLDSQFAMMETIISALVDNFSRYLRHRKMMVTAVTCIVGFLCGLPCVTYGGIYVVTLMNWYSASFSLMIVSLFEIIVIMYIYGMPRFMDDIKMMIGFKPDYYWYATWFVITPAIILFILIASAVGNVPAYYDDYVFPPYAQSLGWLMMLSSILLIPGFFLFEIFYNKDLRMTVKNSMMPRRDWGPALTENRIGYYAPRKEGYENDGYENGSTADSYPPDYRTETTGL